MQAFRNRRQRLRRVSPEEAQLWRRATADVTPLAPGDGSGEPPAEAAAVPELASPAAPVASAPTAARATPGTDRPAPTPPARQQPTAQVLSRLSAGAAADIDRRTLSRLRRGLIAPETQVDLHSCTQEEAYVLLAGFLAASQAAGRRCVLVITGKGYRGVGGVGVLKRMVPQWLNEAPNRPRIIAFSQARPPHGGEGALYVLLRRVRDPSQLTFRVSSNER